MISHIADAVLLLALVLTAIRVGTMHRELRRLRGHHAEYVEVFNQTTRALDNIDSTVRHIGREGRDVLERLETAIGQARALSKRLEDMARAAHGNRSEPAAPAEAGGYIRKAAAAAASEDAAAAPRNEILRFAADSRPSQERRADAAGEARFSPPHQPVRDFRMAPSVKTLRAAGGNG
jgi:hypothetical protein